MATLTVPGVIGHAPSYYIDAEEAMEYLGCKKNKAYEVIRGLRKELIDSGKLYPGFPQGKVPRRYFLERCMIEEPDPVQAVQVCRESNG